MFVGVATAFVVVPTAEKTDSVDGIYSAYMLACDPIRIVLDALKVDIVCTYASI